MKKRTYHAVNVNRVDFENLWKKVEGRKITVGTDIGKEECLGALKDENGQGIITIKVKNPSQVRQFVELLEQLPARQVEVVMEPSGTYGDPLRNMLWKAGIKVYRVSAKRSHDAAEVYDGVPSSHDAKSAAIIAKLHQDGASELWPHRTKEERDLSAVVKTMDAVNDQMMQELNRLEAQLARHWPEVSEHLELDSATLLGLLIEFGGPQKIKEEGARARKVMRKIAGGFLKGEKIEEVIKSAKITIGVEMTEVEEAELKSLVGRIRDLIKLERKAKKRLEFLSANNQSVKAMGEVVGKATAAVLVSEGGDPRNYKNPAQWVKNLGLNLKEHSSGKKKGNLAISKRGSGKARRWEYFAALRLVHDDVIIRAWYNRKVIRDGGVKMKAIVSIMRKLTAALWYVAQGSVFDSKLMFDVKRLGVVTD